MKKHEFQVRPLASYEGARYLSAYGRATGSEAPAAEAPAEETTRSWTEILQSLAMLALVLTLSLTMVACFDRHDDDGHQEQWTSDGGSGDGGNDHDGGDITLGIMVECNPGDVYCSDETTLQTCTDSYWYETTDCNDWCQQEYGADDGTVAWSNGCNAEAPEPCQCAWDMIDGGAPYYCAPEEVSCVDESTVQLCDDAGSFFTEDCNAYCQQQDPSGYAWSAGCNAAAEDPCQCQYDIVDGDIAACTPGDVYCSDANTANVCNDDNWSYTPHDCATYCSDTYGPQYSSSGCDATTPDNFCGCVLYMSP